MSFRSSFQRHEIRDGILQYVTAYSRQNGRCPKYRDICRALNLGSLSTVSRYMHELMAEGLVPEQPEPRSDDGAPPAVRVGEGPQRFCLMLADGGRLFVDCELLSGGRLCFSGVVDAEELRGSVSRVVRAYPVGEED